VGFIRDAKVTTMVDRVKQGSRRGERVREGRRVFLCRINVPM
jgi:hypothetical protein